MGLFKKLERRSAEGVQNAQDALLTALTNREVVTPAMAMEVPAFKTCVNFIASTIASLPIYLYEEKGNNTFKVDDNRTTLLNDDTGDTLDGYQMKKAFVTDYLVHGAGYIYINRRLNKAVSLHYVENGKVDVLKGTDPIFKNLKFTVQGQECREFNFIRVTYDTVDGASGSSIVSCNSNVLSVAYNTLCFEKALIKNGGNKKGFLKSIHKISGKALDEIKEAWRNLYGNNQNNMMVLNDGMDFKESSNTSVEMQLNENKQTNDKLICGLFNVSPNTVYGRGTTDEYETTIKTGIQPHLTAIECAINKALLLESEKPSRYFAFDTTELLKGDILRRYQAYEIALRNNFLQMDEVRYIENKNPLGFNYIKLGLQDVLLNPKTNEVYTPNTNATANLGKLNKIGGELSEAGNTKQG